MKMKYIYTILLVSISQIISAQSTDRIISNNSDIPVDENLSKQIMVVTEYEPSVSDAFKINQLPQPKDTASTMPQFRYNIVSTPVETKFTLTPITAARMRGEPLSKLYRNQATIGFGNYLTTHANLKINSIRSSKHQYGIDLYHFGSFADIKLENDQKVPAGFSTNYLNLNGKKFFENAHLFGDFGIQHESFKYYGYDIKNISTTDGPTEDDAKQRYLYLHLKGGIASNKLDSSKFHHKSEIQYLMTNEITGITEHGIATNFQIKKYFDDKAVAIDLSNDFFSKSGKNSKAITSDLLSVTPWGGIQNEMWQVKIGISLSGLFGSYEAFTVYPRIYADFNIADNMIVPYFIYTGNKQYNSMYTISLENKYMHNGLNVAPTNLRNIVTGGIKGTITPKIPFNINATYTDARDMYFFVNDEENTAMLKNKFDVVYDDAHIFNLHAELGFVKQERINVLFQTNYYSYNLSKEEHPWHKPELELSLKSKYNMQNKFIFNLDLFYIGSRYAITDINTKSSTSLNGFFDANLGIEYRYTKILSAFLNLNNIAAMRYQQWYLYPSQRFNAMLGVSYIF
jgi:hypothetical protein